MIWLDLETFGTLDLRKVGGYRYAAHEDTEVLLLLYALDDGPAKCIDIDGRSLNQAIHEDAPDLYNRLECDMDYVTAHNTAFDRKVMDGQGVVIPVERWEDTMVQAFSLGLPGSLDALGRALHLPEATQKLKTGKQLISRFCKPAPKNHKADRYDKLTHPEEWKMFIEYGLNDINAMRECARRMPRWNLTTKERDIWLMDQAINELGVRVDLRFVKKAVQLAEATQAQVTEDLQHETWGAVEKHTKSAAIKTYCEEHGIKMPDLTKETVTEYLKGDLPPTVRRVLQLRQEANKATVSKYIRMGAMTGADGRLRGGTQYGGAKRTLRWAGRGVQLHNLARPDWWLDQDLAADALMNGTVDVLYPDPLDVVKGLVRGAFVPAKGCEFHVSDLSNIEGRVSAWVADEAWKVEAFRAFDRGEGPDIYKATYAASFGKNVEDVTKDDRQIGKVQELAGGYQGWVGAWETFSKAYGLDMMPEDEICEIMGNWRNAHPQIKNIWASLERGFYEAVENPGNAYKVGKHLAFRYYPKQKILLVKLPSGRYVPYLNPKIGISKRHGKPKYDLSYMGDDDKGRWVRIDTYGGKLLENIVQALSRDILAEAMLRMHRKGFKIVLHVHDEVVVESVKNSPITLDVINDILGQSPEWAKDLPLAAAGFTSNRYRKD